MTDATDEPLEVLTTLPKPEDLTPVEELLGELAFEAMTAPVATEADN